MRSPVAFARRTVFDRPMALQTPERDDLRQRLERLDRAIALKQFEIDCAAALGHQDLERSDLGWLVSILDGPLGTVTAVLNGRRSARRADHTADLGQELASLRTEREILEALLER